MSKSLAFKLIWLLTTKRNNIYIKEYTHTIKTSFINTLICSIISVLIVLVSIIHYTIFLKVEATV